MLYSNKPVKLADCHQRGIETANELFIVEGDSAALAVTRMRNAQLQAVLPMQGKPMNTLKISEQKTCDNFLFKALIEALGAGIGDTFNINNRRYAKIILLMDPDADGIHCGALMLMFFYRWMRPLLESGMIEMVRAPVGEITDRQTGETQFAYTDAEFKRLWSQKDFGGETHNTVRYRGLAGMPQIILERVCINVDSRKTNVMGIRDAEMAIKVFGGTVRDEA